MNQSGFWWILFACLVFGVVHSFLASNTAKKFAAERLGERAVRYYRFFYVVAGLITTALLLLPVKALPDSPLYGIPRPWVYFTLLIQLAAGVCLLISLQQTGTMQFLGVAPFFAADQKAGSTPLVTSGFYAWVRHPIYFFSFILMWFFPFMTWNLLALFIGLTLYTLIGSLFEERRMVAEYGEEYRAYHTSRAVDDPN